MASETIPCVRTLFSGAVGATAERLVAGLKGAIELA
jgi:hypothetical protein